jgi:hypothetical protein
MKNKLTEKDRNIITGAVFVALLVAALLTWGYFANQRKAAEPKSLLVELAQTAGDAATAAQQEQGKQEVKR